MALQTLKNAKRIANNLTSQYTLIDKNISNTQALINDCKNVNIPIKDVEQLLAKSISSLKNDDYKSSLSYSEKSKELAGKRKRQYYRAQDSIKSAQKLILEGEKFLDGTNSRILLNEAKEAMQNHDYTKAVELVEKAENIFKELKKYRDKASNILIVSQQRIDELKNLNVDTKELVELYDYAKEFFNKGQYGDVSVIGNKIYERTQNLKGKYHLLDSTIFCSECGVEIDADSLFCPECGAKID